MIDITHYLTFDLPVPYKKLKIWPATVRDYLLFNYYAQCFLLDKNSIPDAKIISMKELEYIYVSTQTDFEHKPYLFWFDRVLSISLKEDESFKNMEESLFRYKFYEGNQHNPYFVIDGENYFENDYQEIKSIICEQNLIELPDESLSKDVRDSLEKARKYKHKDEIPATLEEYIISLATVTGWKLEYIYDMSVRKFVRAIRKFDQFIHYKIFLSASMSGMVEFKENFIKHWLTGLDEKDRYTDVSVDLEEIQGKVSFEKSKEDIKKRTK